jgi:hypothetical protein
LCIPIRATATEDRCPQTGETRILLEDLADIASASRWATTTPIPKETR